MNFLLKKQNKTNIVKHQRLLPFTKNSHLKLMILVLFYVWERCQSLDSEIIPDTHLKYRGPISCVVCFFQLRIPLRVHRRGSCNG